MEPLASNLQVLRKAAGHSWATIAEATSIAKEALRAYEQGTAAPAAPDLLALARFWDCSVDALLRVPFEGRATARPFAAVQLLVLDVDGVLTDGSMLFSDQGLELKAFNSRDGLGLKRLLEHGIEVAFLSSGRNAALVERRAAMLGVQRVAVGERPKQEQLVRWQAELGVARPATAYVGDDVNDAAAMALCGLRACPADAVPWLKQQANVQLRRQGGAGCVRELIDDYILPVRPR